MNDDKETLASLFWQSVLESLGYAFLIVVIGGILWFLGYNGVGGRYGRILQRLSEASLAEAAKYVGIAFALIVLFKFISKAIQHRFYQ